MAAAFMFSIIAAAEFQGSCPCFLLPVEYQDFSGHQLGCATNDTIPKSLHLLVHEDVHGSGPSTEHTDDAV